MTSSAPPLRTTVKPFRTAEGGILFELRAHPNINKVLYASRRYNSYGNDAVGEKHKNKSNPLENF